jgi:hypothetical protein
VIRILLATYPRASLRIGWGPDRNWQLLPLPAAVARWFGHRNWPL